jgi:C4-dicarboxylate-binding protein DctP
MSGITSFKARKIIFPLTLVFFLISVFFCGAPKTVSGKEQFKMRIAHTNSPKDARHLALELYKAMIEVRTGGQIKVEIYPSGQLGNEPEAFKGVMLGTIEATSGCIDGYMPQFLKEANVLSIPYLYPSEAVWCEVFYGEFGKEFADLVLRTTGMRVLGFTTAGYAGIGNNVRPLRKPEDLKGLKIRSMPSPALMKFLSAAGGNPVPLAWAEVYGALQHKVVDGVMTSVMIWEDAGLDEVLKYGTATYQTLAFDGLMVNEKWFKGLPSDFQAILKEAALVWRQYQNGLKLKKEHEAAGRLEKKGVKMHICSREEINSFKEVTQKPIIAWVIKEKLGGDRTWVDKILKASKQAQEEVDRLWLAD